MSDERTEGYVIRWQSAREGARYVMDSIVAAVNLHDAKVFTLRDASARLHDCHKHAEIVRVRRVVGAPTWTPVAQERSLRAWHESGWIYSGHTPFDEYSSGESRWEVCDD